MERATMMPPEAPFATEIPEISVVIPCWNEEENVRQIHAAVRAELIAHARSYEILFIDNDSSDATRALLREICQQDPHTRAIFNTRNYGQMRSPTYGIYQAEGAAVIGMGADFQDPPAMIGPMIAQWRQGAQVVLAQRKTERASWGLRMARFWGYKILGGLADYPVIPNVTGFGLFDRACVDALAAWHEPEPFFRGMVIESGYRVALLPYERPERAAGTTKNNFFTLLDFAVSSLAGSAKAMLRVPMFVSIYAALMAGLSLIAAFGLLFVSTSAATILGIIGLQLAIASILLFFLGVMGEQIRVISERSRHVPLVLESERLNFPESRTRPAARTFVQGVGGQR